MSADLAYSLQSVSRFEKGAPEPLLHSISADFKKGQLIAIVGADGDGICDNCGAGYGNYVDADGDGVCDNWTGGEGAYGNSGQGAGWHHNSGHHGGGHHGCRW